MRQRVRLDIPSYAAGMFPYYATCPPASVFCPFHGATRTRPQFRNQTDRWNLSYSDFGYSLRSVEEFEG